MGKRQKNWQLIPVAALLLASIGCATTSNDEIRAKANMPPPVLEQSEFLYHRSRPGETFASIAKWYSGQESNWREIGKVNPGMNPWRLKKDDIVKVPVALATLHADQPKYSTAPRPKPKKTSAGTRAVVQGNSDEGEASVEGVVPEEPVFGPK